MAKRMTDTEKWRDPWFCELVNRDRMFWMYLLDNCSHSGVWQVNWMLVKVYFGEDFEYNNVAFGERIVQISPAKWFIPKFIRFQYGTLSSNNKAHLSVMKALLADGINPQTLEIQAPCKPLASPLQGAKDKDKDNSVVVVKGGVGGDVLFDQFWAAYPNKQGKVKAREAWVKAIKHGAPPEVVFIALEEQKQTLSWQKDNGSYIPHPSTWLNQKRWEDDIQSMNRGKIKVNGNESHAITGNMQLQNKIEDFQ